MSESMSREIVKKADKIAPRLLTTRQAADYLNLSQWTIRRLWYRREIKAIDTLKHMRYDVQDLDAWIEAQKEASL